MITAHQTYLASQVAARLARDLQADNVSVKERTGADAFDLTFYFDTAPDLTAVAPVSHVERIMAGRIGDALYAQVLKSLRLQHERVKREAGMKDQFSIYSDDDDPRLGLRGGADFESPAFGFKRHVVASFPTTPPPSPMKNYENIVQLAQDEIMTTIVVKLLNNAYQPPITCRCYKEEAKTLAVGDTVLVPVTTANSGGATHLQVATVEIIHPESILGPDSPPAHLILGSIQSLVNHHKEQTAKEAEMVERLKKIDAEESRKKAKTDVLAALTLSEKQVLGLAAPADENPS